MSQQLKNALLGGAALVIAAVVAFVFMGPTGDVDMSGQAIGDRGGNASQQSEEQQGEDFENAHYAEFDGICDDVAALMEGNTPDGNQMSSAASPCGLGGILSGDADAIRECCLSLGHIGCHIYCQIQEEHSYNTCMNGWLFWDGCLDKVEDMCDDLIAEAATLVKQH
jgi:hypothetical protein